MICPVCDRETSAVTEIGEMGAGKLRKHCSYADCKALLPEAKPVPQAVPAVASAVASPSPVEQRPAPKQAPSLNGAPPTFAEILGELERRLPYVRERIAELRAYEAEERQLVTALNAAGRATAAPENKPS